MSLNEILEQLPKLTDDEKRQLWNILDRELAGEGEESPEFLAELDTRVSALDHGTQTYSLDEARQMVRDTITRARRYLSACTRGGWDLHAKLESGGQAFRVATTP